MEISLEKIDIIRERSNISYKDAKEALEKNGGDVVETLVYLEEKENEAEDSWTKNATEKGEEIVDIVKEIIRKGNVTKIVIKKNEKVLMNIPVSVGAVGAALALPATALGLITALATKCSVEIVKEDGEIVNVNDMADETIEKASDIADETAEKINDMAEKTIELVRESVKIDKEHYKSGIDEDMFEEDETEKNDEE